MRLLRAALAACLVLLGSAASAYAQALPATLAVPWGGKTLRRLGGFVVPYTGAGTPGLTGACATAGWQLEAVADETNTTRWMLNLAGTAAAAAPVGVSGAANGATFSCTISDGVDSSAVTITIEANAYDVRPKWADVTTTELRQTLSNTVQRVQLGDTIRLRPGTYGLIQGVPTTTQRIRYLTPQGTWTGSNYVKIAPRTAFEATWHRMNLDPATATSGLTYLWLEGIRFTSADLTAGENPNTIAMLRSAAAAHYVKVSGNRFWGVAPAVVNPPAGTGYNVSQGVNFIGNFWTLDANDFQDTWGPIVNGPATYNRGAVITNNTAARFQNDFLKFNGYEFTVTDNFATHKLHPDPADGGASGTAGAHGDFIQHTGWTDGLSRTAGTVARNIMVRGQGRNSWVDGQGFFLEDSNNGSRLLGLTIENNLYVGTFANGLIVKNSLDPLVRNNLLLLDPTVGNTVNPNTGTGSQAPASPKIAFTSGASGLGGSGGVFTGNVSIGTTTFGAHSPVPTTSNNLQLSATAPSGDTSYADNFAAPAYGASLGSAAAVKAAFKPKVGGPLALAGAGPLDTDGNWRTFDAATAITLSGPAGGVELVTSSNFTVGANGTLSATVTVTPADGGVGGVFAPASVAISSAAPTATFTYTPPLGAAARSVSVTNTGGLANPAAVTYQVAASPVTTVTLSVPPVLFVGIPDTIAASVDGVATGTITVTLDAVAGLTFGGPITIAAGQSNGATTVTPSTTGSKVITGSDNAGLNGPTGKVVLVAPAPANLSKGQLCLKLGIC